MRFIVRNNPNESGLESVTTDEMLYQMREDGKIADTIFLWKPGKFMYLLNTASVNHIDMDYAKAIKYPVLRAGTLQGSPTSILIVGNMWCIVSALGSDNWEEKEYGKKLSTDVWRYVLSKLGLETEVKGNDIVVAETDRKLSGTGLAQRGESQFMNCFLSEKVPTGIDMDKLFKMPPSKYEDKTVTKASERITSVEKEIGEVFDEKWLVDTVIEYFASIGVALEREDDFTQEEKDFRKSLEEKHLSENWIKYGEYGQEPDFI
jgi:lipoate-protein ligase A